MVLASVACAILLSGPPAAAAPAASNSAITPELVEQSKALLERLRDEVTKLDTSIADGDERLASLTDAMEATDDPGQRARLQKIILRFTEGLDALESRRDEIARLVDELNQQISVIEGEAPKSRSEEKTR